jgi:hypothetical protein
VVLCSRYRPSCLLDDQPVLLGSLRFCYQVILFFLPGGAENLPLAAMRGSIFLGYFSTKAAEAKRDPMFGNAGGE